MKTRILILTLLAVAVCCGMSPAGSAQSPCFLTQPEFIPAPLSFGWFVWPQFGLIFYEIAAATNQCSPAKAKDETCPTCPSATKPISLATGNTFIKQTDVQLPGLGGGLNLARTWNSQWPLSQAASSVGLFGPNWRSTYEERVFLGADGYLKYARADGSFWSFGLNSSTGTFVFVAPANMPGSLVEKASYLDLTFQDGEQREFSLTTGLLTAIVDRNGNTTQMTYDGSNRLTTVTDAASRHLYFNYANSSYPYQVTSVTSDFGVTISYTYDAQGRLGQVTEPDSTTLSFTYNSQSQITQVTDSNGKVLESHTYDSSGRGLTASQANGVNSVTITYPQ